MSDPTSANPTSSIEDTLLAGLTPPQREAVTHVDGPLLVLAGPGSGKTRVITRRVAYLVRGVGIAPWNVLAITFTNKAAGEMRERVGELLSEREARAATIATFHSLCARLLRRYADRLGLPAGYSIYDSSDQQRAIKQALNDLEINPKNFPPNSMLHTISNAKNELADAETFAQTAGDFYSRTVAKVYKKYSEILTRNHALDFDDLLLKTVQLLKQHPDVLAELRDRYQYVLIDEYQDTNHAQFMLANALASGHQNLCATGDPDQSIYGWRGANIRNILEFEQHYPEAKTVRLEQNYRSTKKILAAADGLIRHNRARKHKQLFTDNDDGEAVQVVTLQDERQEAEWLVDRFREAHEQEKLSWGEMAVFYRMNSLSRVVEDALRDAGVPYQIARGTAFYDRAEIKDAVAYLRVIANPADEVNLLRIINTPTRGIGNQSIKAMQAYSLANNRAMDEIIRDPMSVPGLSNRAQNAVAKFAKMVDAWRTEAGLNDAPDFLSGTGHLSDQSEDDDVEISLRELVERVIVESTLEEHYRKDKSDPDQERLANLGELISSAQQFEEDYLSEVAEDGGDAPSLSDKLLALLERISLVSDVDGVDEGEGTVTLMTLHAAKGLEFPIVAMVGVEDGLLPHQRSQNDGEKGEEEERRLCFVGMTRAMRRLYMTNTRYRTIFGQTMPVVPSRFLNELPPDTIETTDASLDDGDPFGDDLDQRTSAREQAGEFPPGTRVRHPQFGIGRIITVSSAGAHTRARVEFNAVGVKTLILQYARLEKV